MPSTYNRKKEGRKTQVLILEQITSEEEIKRAIEVELDKKERENARELEEFTSVFSKVRPNDAERDFRELRSLGEMLSVMPCSFCLDEHHPSDDCAADEDVRLHNESQQYSPDPRDVDMYF